MHNLTARNRQRLTLGTAFVGAALLLASCGDGGTTPEPTPNPNVISGQISPWTAGWANQVMPDNAAIENPGADFKANVNSAGQFDLNLPGAAVMDSTYASDLMTFPNAFALCSTFQSNAPVDMKISQINKLYTDTNKSITASSNNGTTFLFWWYANKTATVTMSGSDCSFGSIAGTLALNRGWNVVQLNVSTAGGKNVGTYSVVGAPTQRVTFTSTNSALSIQGLSPDILTPWVKANTSAK